MTYLAPQSMMSVTWGARAFDLPEDRVREYIDSLQNRAAERRDE